MARLQATGASYGCRAAPDIPREHRGVTSSGGSERDRPVPKFVLVGEPLLQGLAATRGPFLWREWRTRARSFQISMIESL